METEQKDKKNINSHEKRLLSLKDFTAIYNVSRSKAYDMLAKEEIQGHKAGGKTVIKTEEAERWHSSLPRSLHTSMAESIKRKSGQSNG